MKSLTTTCLVSNYNYAQFVSEAVESALRQTTPFNQIVVVDDGSTDGSLELLHRRFGGNPQVRIHAKPNAGQLSCFNVGAEIATGDIVYFLDADDVYEPHYVEHSLAAYAHHPTCDFLFCDRRLFGKRDEVERRFPSDRDYGYTVLRTAFLREWIGASTSCVSLRRTVLNKVLPLPFVDEWRVRADDCLVFGASLAGARKRYLAQPLVKYRVHGDNHFRGRRADPSATYRRRLAINRLFEHFERQFCYNLPAMAEHLHREFCTLEQPTASDLTHYLRVGRCARLSLLKRLTCFAAMVHRLLRGSAHSPEPASANAAALPMAEPATLPFARTDEWPSRRTREATRRAA